MVRIEDKILKCFEKIFAKGENPRCFFAPGRVNLIGEHIDYNGGHVLPCALNLGTYIAARKRSDKKILLYSMNMEDKIYEFSLDEIKRENEWTDYPLGIVYSFDKHGFKIDKGFEAIIYGNIPTGSGLSSSASLEVLTAYFLKELFDIKVSMIDIAKISQYSENNFNGCKCGIMDQFASAMGKKNKAIFLDTKNLSYQYADLNLGENIILISNTKKKHKLTDSQYNKRCEECNKALNILKKHINIENLCELKEAQFEEIKHYIDDETIRKRAKHVVYENARTIKALKFLENNDISSFARLMNESHISLRDDYDVTGKELDTLVEEAWKIDGVMGSRMTGAGFGGCTVSIVNKNIVNKFIEKVGEAYKEKIGYQAEFYELSIGNGPREIVIDKLSK